MPGLLAQNIPGMNVAYVLVLDREGCLHTKELPLIVIHFPVFFLFFHRALFLLSKGMVSSPPG